MTKDNKLKALRELLAKHQLAAYMQPVHDEYLSEYPPLCNQRVQWLSGFSGSAGTVVVLANKAALFTDGRYTLQAKNETDGKIFEQYNSGDKTPEAWLAEQLTAGERVSYDAKLYTKTMLKRMKAVLGKKNIALTAVDNLVDAIWVDRPAAPASSVFIHELAYAGEDAASKRQRMAKHVAATGADACIITAPDAICWLLNVRASDVECTPLLLCNAILFADGRVQLYVDAARCNDNVRAHLDDVELRDPATLKADLQTLAGKTVLCDSASVPLWFTQILSEAGATIMEGENPCILAKATKNPVELQGMQSAHVRDGVAITKLLYWLDNEAWNRPITELDIANKLLALRAEQALFVEPSFPTIAGSGPNGAIVHYRADAKSNRAVRQGELLLLDSGGQYRDGTTDITRTIPIGEPKPEYRDRFTRVLKGHIAIATAVFPKGTAGSQLDALARQHLWQAGLDYDHGTGHGVGCFLGVHEGPQRISKRGGDAALLPGMIVSNEPGYYKTGEYGIRIESLVVVEKAPRKEKYLQFATLTCAPIDTRLVDAPMLTVQEEQWLNDYHAWVLSELSSKLTADEQKWLKQRCAPV